MNPGPASIEGAALFYWNSTGGADGNGAFERVQGAGGAASVVIGTAGGANSVTTLEQFLVAGGAAQTGTARALPSGRVTLQAVANGSSGAYTATITIKVSNDGSNFEAAGTITLSGTATTADSDGFAIDAPWAFIRADVSGLTGTGATCNVYMGV